MIVIPRQFAVATPFIGEHALIMKDNKIGIIDRKGAVVLAPTFDAFDMSYMLALENNPRGFLDYCIIATDFFNPEDLAAALAEDCDAERFEGLSAATTFADLKQRSPGLSEPVAGNAVIESMLDVPITPESRLFRTVYTFTASPASTPAATLKEMQFEIRLLGPAINKQKPLLDALKKAFAKVGMTVADESADRSTFHSAKHSVTVETSPKRLIVSATFTN
jgi:hypothetical protein